jgi:hypothetical protein
VRTVWRGILLGALVMAGSGCAASRTVQPRAEVVTEVEIVTRAGGGARAGGAVMTLDALTESWGCGNGWAVSTADQTVGLLVMPSAGDGDLPASAAVAPGGPWTVELRFGRDLFANWCDDVVEPDEPEPAVDRTFTGVAGTLAFVGAVPAERFDCPQEVEVEATDLVVADGDTTIELGSGRLVNTSWGCFAG